MIRDEFHCMQLIKHCTVQRTRALHDPSRSIEASSHETIQVGRQISGGSLKFLPFTEHHFKYDLYNVVLLHVSFSCSRRNNKSLKFTLFNRGLIGICLLIPVADVFKPELLPGLLAAPPTSSLGFLREPIACKAVKLASLCLNSSISARCIC